jgi:fatty aldehyde-generating acyl-ACP reductase
VIDVALLGHLESTADYAALLDELRPRARSDPSDLADLLAHLQPAPVCDVELRSTTGAPLTARYTLTARYIDLFLAVQGSFHPASARRKLARACVEARKTGARLAALGGFASIAGERDADLADAYGLAFTTGNTLTAAVIAAQTASVADAKTTVTVVGAAGDVGSALCRVLYRNDHRLLLVGRSPRPLESLAAELRGAEVRELHDALARTDVLVLVASAPMGGIALAGLPPHARVIDAGHPRNATPTGYLWARGGRVHHAVPPSSDLPVVLRFAGPPGETHACLAEACVLAYEDRLDACSLGRGRISPAATDAMLERAARHGITPAPLRWESPLYAPVIP